ncbi:hypothetical protein JCM33374_g4605 [Metschnikowia sp. JCM 33374]|nr:hypothetical protein JCM33374_g4605 [Metschnikowia sp. JCM 33374]
MGKSGKSTAGSAATNKPKVNVKNFDGKIIGRPIPRTKTATSGDLSSTKVPSPSNVLVTQSKELSMMDFVDPSDTESEDEEDFPSSLWEATHCRSYESA